MTTFKDGPAKGVKLLLKLAPDTLRVVKNQRTGKWDALDDPRDEPQPDETVHNYRRVGEVGVVHLNRGSKPHGFYPIAEYQHAP